MPDKDWRVTFEFVEPTSGRINDTTMTLREHVLSPADNLNADTVAADVDSWLGTLARAMAPTIMQLGRVHVNRGGPYGPGEGDPQEAGEHVNGSAGTLAASGSQALPHGLCARVTVYTALASKRGRGRFRAPWPEWAGYLATADTWNNAGAYITAVSAFASAALAGHDAVHDAITHHYSLRVHSRADAATRDATSVSVRPGVSYLRSRLTSP